MWNYLQYGDYNVLTTPNENKRDLNPIFDNGLEPTT